MEKLNKYRVTRQITYFQYVDVKGTDKNDAVDKAYDRRNWKTIDERDPEIDDVELITE